MVADRFFNDTEHAYECGLQDGLKSAGNKDATIRELCEALKPFAEYSSGSTRIPDHFVITQGSVLARWQLTIGQCRKAEAALASAEKVMKP